MSFQWQPDRPALWDADKQAFFGPEELASVGLSAPAPEFALADEWWRVSDDAGALVGYGWLDCEWGDAQITFVVAPEARGRGAGRFILDQLEGEARSRGVNYVYNVVPPSHPDAAWMTHWLTLHGFFPSAHGDLRRQVGPAT